MGRNLSGHDEPFTMPRNPVAFFFLTPNKKKINSHHRVDGDWQGDVVRIERIRA